MPDNTWFDFLNFVARSADQSLCLAIVDTNLEYSFPDFVTIRSAKLSDFSDTHAIIDFLITAVAAEAWVKIVVDIPLNQHVDNCIIDIVEHHWLKKSDQPPIKILPTTKIIFFVDQSRPDLLSSHLLTKASLVFRG